MRYEHVFGGAEKSAVEIDFRHRVDSLKIEKDILTVTNAFRLYLELGKIPEVHALQILQFEDVRAEKNVSRKLAGVHEVELKIARNRCGDDLET